jgi:ERF superfamily
VQRSSDKFGMIAAALAKAQAQLVNPEKSLVATIHSGESGGSQRSFRYASLSSGLDIVRKTLSQHEIATLQTTSIDETVGIVRLSTVLAQIASDWPVCAISETAAPHRMGAALTYARRYALFTLVGIAGEDDLDASDLIAPTMPTSRVDQAASNRKSHFNGGQGPQLSAKRPKEAAPRLLQPDASSALRDQLITEVENLTSADEAADWARRVFGKKNTLVEADAVRVEQAFQARLAIVSGKSLDESRQPDEQERPQLQPRRGRPATIDKSVLALPARRRVRDREHVKSVAKQPCLVCGRRPADAHHLKFAQSRALGRKVSDEFTVPLCRGHHREVHRCGNEAAWWNKVGTDPTVTARALWLKTHPLPQAANSAPALRMRRSKLQNKPKSGTNTHDHISAD